jgi:tetratricopeptide (TPR) repeat protein
MIRSHSPRSKNSPNNRWDRLLVQLNCRTGQALARQLEVSVGAVSGFRGHLLAGEFQEDRTVWHSLLPRLAQTFLTVNEMRDWLQKTGIKLDDWQWDIVRKKLREFDFSGLIRRYVFPSTLRRLELEKSLKVILASKAESDVGKHQGGIVVSGMPGIGKTTVVAYFIEKSGREKIRQRFADGVIWVDLEDREQEEALSDLAEHLGIEAERGKSLKPVLSDRLRKRRVLMIVDGANSLRDAEEFTDLIDFSAGRVIITTQELPTDPELKLRGKGVSLDLLIVPEMGLDEGVMLLEKCLKNSDQAYDAELARQLCELTRGLPLALEIAAGLVDYDKGWQTVIADVQKRQVAALKYPEDRSRLDKHGSVQILFDLSYKRLQEAASPEVVRGFRSLGLLAGLRFSPGVWCQVLNMSEDQFTVNCLRFLQRLSLVRKEADGVCQLHALLRSYAAAKLCESNAEYLQLEAAYVNVYGNLAASLAQSFGVSSEVISSLLVNQADIWHALSLVLEKGEETTAITIARDMANLCTMSGQLQIYESFLKRIEAIAFPKRSPIVILIGLEVARLAALRGNCSAAITLAEKVLAAGLEGIDQANCLLLLVDVYCRVGQIDSAAPLVERLKTEAEKLRDVPIFYSNYLRVRGVFSLRSSQPQEALTFFEQAVEADEQTGLFEFLPTSKYLYGECLLALERSEEAIRELSPAWKEFREKNWPVATSGLSALCLAEALINASDLAMAATVLDELEQDIRRQPFSIDEVVLGQLLGRLWLSRGRICLRQENWTQAISQLETSVEYWRKAPGLYGNQQCAFALGCMAHAYGEMGNLPKARALRVEASQLLEKRSSI